MLLIDKDHNSAIAIGQLCGAKYRQTSSGKSMCLFSVIIGTHKDEFDNWVNDFQSCVAYVGLADYINEVSQEQTKTKYLVGGILKESEYNGEIKTQIVVEYISPQPIIKQTLKSKKQDSEEWGDGDTEFID